MYNHALGLVSKIMRSSLDSIFLGISLALLAIAEPGS
jgi:hypothetical protein